MEKENNPLQKISTIIQSHVDAHFINLNEAVQKRFKLYDEAINILKTQVNNLIIQKENEIKEAKIRENTYKNISITIGVILAIIQFIKLFSG